MGLGREHPCAALAPRRRNEWQPDLAETAKRHRSKPQNRIVGVPSQRVGVRIDPDVARQIVDALSRIEAAEAGRRFIYTVATESQSPGVGTGEHSGVLITHDAGSITIGADTGEVEIGWYEITSISVASD